MTQRNLLSESNQMQDVNNRFTFALGKQKTECNGAEVKPCEYTIIIMARDLMQGKRLYDRLKNQARQQMALMNKCRMLSRRTGRGGQQPFYVQFLNR